MRSSQNSFLVLILKIVMIIPTCNCTQSSTTNQQVFTTISIERISQLTREIKIKPSSQNFSLMILPIQNCCPACRRKILRRISKQSNKLGEDKFFVISVFGGSKLIQSYFNDLQLNYPKSKFLVIDSLNRATDLGIIYNKPLVIYCDNKKKVNALICEPNNVSLLTDQFLR